MNGCLFKWMGIGTTPITLEHIAKIAPQIFCAFRLVRFAQHKANARSVREVVSAPIRGANIGDAIRYHVLVVVDTAVWNLFLVLSPIHNKASLK